MDPLRLRGRDGVDEPRARWNCVLLQGAPGWPCAPAPKGITKWSSRPSSLAGFPTWGPTWNFQRRLWVLKVGQETKPFPDSFGTKASSHSPTDLSWDMLCNVVRCVGPRQSGLGKSSSQSFFFFFKILGQFLKNLFIFSGG